MLEHILIVCFAMPPTLIFMILGGQTLDDLIAACAGAILSVIMMTLGEAWEQIQREPKVPF